MDIAISISPGVIETPQPLMEAAAISHTAHLTLVTNLQGLLALENNWRALEKSSVTPTSVFQAYDWISAWCRTYCAGDTGQDMHIIAGFDSNKLVFVWPLAIQSWLGLKVLGWLTEPFGQYGDVICAKDQCPRTWTANALRYLRAIGGFDILRLRHVREDSTLASVAAAELVNARLNERAPYLDLTLFKSEADYEERYTGAQRKRRKKIRKHLEDMGATEFRQLVAGHACDIAIDEAIAEKNKWLAERGRINAIMGCSSHAEFLKHLAHSGPNGVETIVTELKTGDRAVSWEIGFRFGGTHFAYITSHVNALTDLSPGRLHMDLSQRACLAAGLKRFDLMVPYDAHKESWSSANMPTQDYFLPLSIRGRMVGYPYLRYIRPVLRNIYYRLPQSILRLINARRGAQFTS